ncbi:amino acid ABC transporter permease [Bacteroides sp. AM10-21B]|nr:amino acid ABC transporter permease [Bacteroides sp. AM10-21B]
MLSPNEKSNKGTSIKNNLKEKEHTTENFLNFAPMRINKQSVITLFFLLCLCACRQVPYPTALITADSLANIMPDSAIHLLESIKTEISTAPEATQMYYRLLCIKAKDKAYILNTTDSLILPILNYYVEKDDKRHLPEAYYYAGRVYRDLGDAPQALPYFYKAMEALPEDTESPLKGKIYSQISTLLLSQKLYEEGLEVLKEGYRYSLLRRDSIDMLFCLRDIGSAYRELERPDSTLHYFREARKLAYAMDNRRMINMTESQVAAVCVQLEDWENAKQALDIAIKSTYLPGLSSTYSIAAEYYYLTGQPDSTIYYCKRIEDVGNVYGKRNACLRMGSISLDRGNPQAALKYINQYLLYNDSVSRLENMETIRKMHSIYNYRLREKENDALKTENSRKTLIMAYSIASGLILLLLFLLYWQHSRRKQLLLNAQLEDIRRLKEEQYQKSTLFIKENKKKIALLEQQLQALGEKDKALRAQLQMQKEITLYANKRAEIEKDEQRMLYSVIQESDIYRLLKEEILPDNRPITREEWKALKETVNDVYDDFTGKLYRYHKLSEHELHICLLLKINMSPIEIARLTSHTKESISSARRRLYEKVFREKGAPGKWDEFIASL